LNLIDHGIRYTLFAHPLKNVCSVPKSLSRVSRFLLQTPKPKKFKKKNAPIPPLWFEEEPRRPRASKQKEGEALDIDNPREFIGK
jgi:hypothetical protein